MSIIIILMLVVIIVVVLMGFIMLRLIERVRKLDQQLAEIVRKKALDS